MTLTPDQRPLVIAGALLFLLGLLEGALVQSFHNPRMGLSAHLTAVQCGMALMLAGLVWPAAALRATLARVARVTLIAGMFGLWSGLTVSAATGASSSLPIAGAGIEAAPTIEALVTVLVLGGSLLMTIGWAIFLLGLVRSGRA